MAGAGATRSSKALGQLVSQVAGAADDLVLGAASADELASALSVLREAQATIERAVVQVGLAANRLSADGRSPAADELFRASGDVRAGRARLEAARVRAAERSPDLAAAVASGANLGADRLDSLARRLGPLDDDTLARVDVDRLAAAAPSLPADTFDAAVRRAVEEARADEGLAEAEAARAASEVRHWFDARRGMGHVHALLDPERYEMVASAIDQHTSQLASRSSSSDASAPADAVALAAAPGFAAAAPDGGRSEPLAKDANLAAQALVALITGSDGRASHLPLITVVVDSQTLEVGTHGRTVRETGDGRPLSGSTVARHCCDAVVQRVVHDPAGLPVDVGRRARTATSGQWAALRSLYRSCAWPGCERPLSHCQAHHIHHWEHGGPTDLDNLVPLCSRHHHLVHEGGWGISLNPDRSLMIVRPDGTHHATTGPPTRRPQRRQATRAGPMVDGRPRGTSDGRRPRSRAAPAGADGR